MYIHLTIKTNTDDERTKAEITDALGETMRALEVELEPPTPDTQAIHDWWFHDGRGR